MKPTGLSWRIGVPFLLLTLVATVTVVAYMRWWIAERQRGDLQDLAAANAAFLEQTGLPIGSRLSADLGRVTGCDVYFREQAGTGTPDARLSAAMRQLPADGLARVVDGQLAVAVELAGGRSMLVVRAFDESLWDARIAQVVVPFWLLALLLAVVVARGLVRPLRSLSARLPNIEQDEHLQVPEAERSDEIGDVARALVATHRGLHDERERRLRAEKLAVLGRMTAALAHEVQNPVAAIKMHAQLWAKDGVDGPAATILGEAERIEGLLNQWMFLTRPEPPAFGRADLPQLLCKVHEAQSARLAHAGVTMAITAPTELVVECDAPRLLQVFGNLVTNAIQAMPEGGDLRVSVAERDGEAVLTFADEGSGFSAQALRSFPQFFFSDKEGGMGIGLAVASEIVVAHGGGMQVENDERGAVVRVRIPVRQLESEEQS